MLYASYTKGYKSGGFNLPQPSPVPPHGVQDEELKATEFGWKVQLGPVRVDGSYFHYKEDNMQVQVTNIATGITSVENAASATTNGAETDIELAATRSLTLGAGVGYLGGTFDDFPGGQINIPCAQVRTNAGCVATGGLGIATLVANLKGKQLPFTPKWTGNAHATYEESLPADLGSLSYNVNESYSSSYFFTADNVLWEPQTWLLSASLQWMSENGHYSVHAYGTNLADREYYSHMAPFSTGGWYVPAPPREYGVTVSYYY